jgi:thymidylate synthase ThyX
MYKAEIIAGSKCKGHKIATFKITFPRFILAELNTHRMLSKNSASSRAIPFEKMVQSVMENPFIPLRWMKEHKGMQGTEYWTDQDKTENGRSMPEYMQSVWLHGRDSAVRHATELHDAGLTKQICNRPLEAYMWHTVIITGTEWENFFAQRAHPDAEIHMQNLAYLMLDAYNDYEFNELQPGQWHMPFGEKILFDMDFHKFVEQLHPGLNYEDNSEACCKIALKVSTAMCARVSYTVVGEESRTPNYAADVVLHDRLIKSGHMSPFEHCAYATGNAIPSGNFVGFVQYRKMLVGENKSDARLKK